MLKKVTITLDESLEKKIRVKQANMIKNNNKSVSFSRVVNQLIEDALRK